jgi:hypothetical protein
MHFNVFECIYRHCNWISPSHSHCSVFAMHTHLHICFSLYTMTPFPTCYTTTFLFFHAHWPIPTFIQSILTFHVYTITPHSTFHVVTGCAEHSGAQVFHSWLFYMQYILSWSLFFALILKFQIPICKKAYWIWNPCLNFIEKLEAHL